MKINSFAAVLLISTSTAFAMGHGVEICIISPDDGATVSNSVQVVFGLSGVGVAPAGVEKEVTGHHHLLTNRLPFGEED